MEEKTRCNLRIQALLDRNGTAMPPCKAFGKRWKHALNQYMGSGALSPEFRYAHDHYLFLEQKQRQLEQEMIGYVNAHWKTEYELLQSIPGIGTILSCYVISEVCPITRFINKRKLRRYAGVVPVFHESAGKQGMGHIPKTSSRILLRWALVQAANSLAKTQTRLGNYYRKKLKQKKKTGIAKVAVASSLSDIIYEVLTKNKPYTTA
jgi:transposase